jgi:pSer/pThr/pTyr-binding forkhead associated (FHA) protein
MNSESTASDNLLPVTDQETPAAAPQLNLHLEHHNLSQTAADHLDGDEFAFAKAPTLMMDLEGHSVHQPEHDYKNAIDATPRYYVQGLVMGQRACLVTNLIAGSSQTLFQPQMVWTIGRNREAALPLRDRVLSRRHAVILYLPEEGFYLIDLNSMNGSYLNGTRLQQRQLLQDGDLIRMGNVQFNFFISVTARSIEPIHPEVLARFISPTSRTEKFIDYSELEEPEILFSTTRDS